MPSENTRIVRRIYAAVEAGDTATVMSLYDPEVIWDFSRSPFASVLDGDAYCGFDGIRQFVEERLKDFQDPGDRLGDLVDVGDVVVSEVTSHGVGRASGAEVARVHYGVWSFHEGRVQRVTWYGSREEALAAAGAAS